MITVSITKELDITDLVFAKIEQGLDEGILKLVQSGETTAESLAPVRTGDLRDGIESRMTGKHEAEVTSAENLEYPFYIELGTYKMAPQPHMTPAANQMERDAEKMVSSEINKAIA